MTDHRTRVHDETRSADIEQARDFLVGTYDADEWHAETTSQPFGFRYSAVGDATMTLRAIRFDGHLEGVMVPTTDFIVQWVTRGTGSIGTGDDRIVSEVGRPQLWPQHGATFTYQDYDQRLVQVDRAALVELAGERGVQPGQLHLDHTIRPDDRAMQIWKNTVSLISHTVMDRQASPLLQAEMGRLGALALLELYPLVTSSLPDELLLPRNAHVRRAVEYVHEHAHRPITSTDLAEVAALSLRALQQAFQRQLGVSPNGYIRQVRLDRVRDALLQGDPGSTSIADVARTWGFAHAGRFSAAYLERHGEYPRATLRR